jgi:hypothetical protein
VAVLVVALNLIYSWIAMFARAFSENALRACHHINISDLHRYVSVLSMMMPLRLLAREVHELPTRPIKGGCDASVRNIKWTALECSKNFHFDTHQSRCL